MCIIVYSGMNLILVSLFYTFVLEVGTTKEHLGFALALGVPTFVVVTKVDTCRGTQVERTLRQLERTLKGPGCRKVPLRVETEDDAVTAATNFGNERSVSLVYYVSCSQ